MGILLNMAYRNLRLYKRKTMIMGAFIAVGIMMMVMGNSIADTMINNTYNLVTSHYTGNIFIRPKEKVHGNPNTIIKGNWYKSNRQLPNYEELYDLLSKMYPEGVMNPQIAFGARIDFSSEKKNQGASLTLLGVEPENYQRVFPETLDIVEGRFLKKGEQGIVIHTEVKEALQKDLNIELKVGDTVSIIVTDDSVRVREVQIVGFMQYAAGTGDLVKFSMIDAHTARELLSMGLQNKEEVLTNHIDTSLLNSVSEDMDSVFSDSSITEIEEFKNNHEVDMNEPIITKESSFHQINEVSLTSGAWTYLQLKPKDSSHIPNQIKELNHIFEAQKWDMEATDWSEATGKEFLFLQAIPILKIVMNLAIAILAILSTIIIVNMLVLSIIQRTTEIGAMRALGAQKNFIRKLFVTEIMLVSFVFGTVGLLVGFLIILILNAIGIPQPTAIFKDMTFLELLWGGKVFTPNISYASILWAYFIMLFIGVFSSLYPVSFALKIQPIKALQNK